MNAQTFKPPRVLEWLKGTLSRNTGKKTAAVDSPQPKRESRRKTKRVFFEMP